MTCSACSAHVEKSVSNLSGVLGVSVNLLQNSMVVAYDESRLSSVEIINAVEKAGYHAEVKNTKSSKDEKNPVGEELKEMRSRLTISICFLLPLMYISMGSMIGLPLPSFLVGSENSMAFAVAQLLLTLPVIYVNRKFFIVGFKALFNKSPNMDSLIAIGSSAATIYSVIKMFSIASALSDGLFMHAYHGAMDLYFESAATILTLITVGKYLEARAKGRTSEAINKLLDLSPKFTTVIRDGKETEIPVEDVVVDDLVVVRSGQSIPVDGLIIEGSASIDESFLTGESLPLDKATGDKVISATVNKSGYFIFRATSVGEDTTLSKIIELVQEANSSKAPIAKLADKVSGIFVPVVITIALVSMGAWLIAGYSLSFALSIGISVLVISCPCALGLATPTAIMVGTGKGAEHGILIKSAESLEIAHKVNTVILDKTGTVTLGKPDVTDIHAVGEISNDEFMMIAASIEKLSDHPLAQAVVSHTENRGLSIMKADDYQALDGRGISAVLNGTRVYAGNRRLMDEINVKCDELSYEVDELAKEGKTPLYFSREDKLLGILALSDVVKPTSKRAIDEMKKMGLEVVMITGDNSLTAEAIRRQMGMDKVIAEVLPQDKEAEVRRIQSEGKVVAMIGDGINDAPALIRADVGIAIGAGTDIAIESADIVLMRSDLLDAVTSIKLSRATIRNVKQNLFWAFFYNSIGIPLAAGVFHSLLGWSLNPMFAAAAMSLSSVCVVTNALRLKLFKPHFEVDNRGESAPEGKEKKMYKTMIIQGMTCGHCSARVEKALNGIQGITATVDLEQSKATITGDEVSNDILVDVVEGAGYRVVEIAQLQ